MITCNEVADYFITIVDESCGEDLTHLKLQKLVYYAQGFHLGLFDKPLFEEPIEAWTHGPVVPYLYHKYKIYKDGILPLPEAFDPANYSEDVKRLLHKIHCVFGQYSAWRLRDFTHQEAPWKNHYGNCTSVIPLESMRAYFKSCLVENGNEI